MDIEAMFGPLKADNDNSRRCPVCSGEVVGRASKVYCCAACQRKGEYLRRDFDKERARKVEMAPEHACEHCGVMFKRKRESRNAARFCSRECGFAAKSNLTVAQRHSAVVRAFRVSRTIKRSPCVVCGAMFEADSFAERYCSSPCAEDWRKRQYIAYNDNGRDRGPRPCAECGSVFAPEYGDLRRVFCTAACGKKHNGRIAKKKRKARMRSVEVESVNPITVFERDDWKCQECGVKTPRNLRGTMKPNAPELDHIMPISLGGAHSYMNTQCLCRKCNGKKSDTPPTQPSLFAYAA